MKNFIFGVFFFFENTVSGIQLYKKNINRNLIIFKNPRKMTNGFFNNSSKLPLDIMKKFFNLGFLAESVKVNTN